MKPGLPMTLDTIREFAFLGTLMFVVVAGMIILAFRSGLEGDVKALIGGLVGSSLTALINGAVGRGTARQIKTAATTLTAVNGNGADG